MRSLIETLVDEYKPKTKTEYKNALQEVIQELTLVGLWRSNFFDSAAFYGGTCLRILHQLNRFSEDLDFSLLYKDTSFDLEPHLKSIERELEISGLQVDVQQKPKVKKDSIRSAFIKTGTLETFIRIGLNGHLKNYTFNQICSFKISRESQV